MKVNDFVLIKGMDSRRVELTNDIDSHVLQLCGHLIVRKGDTNYLIKSRYWNSYATEEANRRFIYDIDFNVISVKLLNRIISRIRDNKSRVIEQIIHPGDNLIIEI